MKISHLMLAVGAIAAASCSSNKNSGDADTLIADTITDTVVVTDTLENGLYCFYLTEGTAKQDTTFLGLAIKDEEVNGEMRWQPAEKDSRKGTLKGILKDNKIKAVWSYMQEGMQDTLSLEFEIPRGNLAQKPLIVNQATGRQQTDASAGYTVVYSKIDCK